MTTFPTRYDKHPGTEITREPITIPAAPPYIAYLNQRPDPKKAILIVDAGDDERSPVKFGKMITEGKYSINQANAAYHAHSSDAGITLYATYTGIGTPHRAEIANKLQTAVNEAEADIIALQTGSGESNTEIDTLKTRMTTAEGDIDTAEADIDSLEAAMGTAQSDIDTAEADIDTLEGNMTTAQGNITTLQGQMGTAQSDIDTAEADIDALEIARGNLQAAIDAAQAQLDIIEAAYVSGPGGSGNNVIPLFDQTTGKQIKTSTMSVSSSSNTTTISCSDPNLIIRMDDYGFKFTETGFAITDSTGNSYLIQVSGTGSNINISIGDTTSASYITIDSANGKTTVHGSFLLDSIPTTTADLPLLVIDANGSVQKATDGLTGQRTWDDYMNEKTHVVTLKNGRITSWTN